MPETKSLYPCPNCGEYKLVYPDVKGEYGWKDTSKYICTGCGKEYPAALVRGGKKA